MSGSVNSVILVGRLTKDPDLQKTQSGISFLSFTVACDRPKRKDDQDQSADFVSCRAWRQQADFLGQYARKGNLVAVNGSIHTGSYQNKDGNTVYTTTVQADRVQILESKSSGGSRNDYPSSGTSYTRDEISRDISETFETGDTSLVSDDDLPF